MACASSCKTQDHPSYGECLRSQGIAVQAVLHGAYTRQAWDAEIKAYRAAKAEGLQPAGTTMKDIDAAKRAADNNQ